MVGPGGEGKNRKTNVRKVFCLSVHRRENVNSRKREEHKPGEKTTTKSEEPGDLREKPPRVKGGKNEQERGG